MGTEAFYRKPNTFKLAPRHQLYVYRSRVHPKKGLAMDIMARLALAHASAGLSPEMVVVQIGQDGRSPSQEADDCGAGSH